MPNRLAFSMIELIFAIVIIAITVLSLPMMSQIASKGVENTLVQEAIFAASAELNQATSYYWDERSMEDGNTSLSKVINTNNDCNATTRLRPGHINQPMHRKCVNNTLNALANNAGGGTVLDLNDAAKSEASIFTGASSEEGYKERYTSKVEVSNVSFGGAPSRDIKEVKVTVYDEAGEEVTSLVSYSANIGEVDYHKRTF